MDKAKAAVSSFLGKDGKHDTTVHETVGPAVTNERVHRTQHNDSQTVVDREVHQDHHHTSIQPIQDKEVLAEQHSHNMAPVEHRQVSHGNDEHVKSRLEKEAAQFKNTREVSDTQHTHGNSGAVVGEHVHHHVHENIQPVIQKETIQPSVVHTTIPVHEVHQNEAKHHTASALPPVSMDDFKRQGGHLSGREERTDAFKGEPKTVGGVLGGKGASGTTSLTENDRDHHNGNGNGLHSGNGLHNDNRTGAVGTTGTHNTSDYHGTAGQHDHNTKKPSMMDKLNPKIDANGDGKAGFMK